MTNEMRDLLGAYIYLLVLMTLIGGVIGWELHGAWNERDNWRRPVGWIKRKKDEHVCPKPELDGLDRPWPGDIWACDECGQHWMIQDSQLDGLYWTPHRDPPQE